jgi:hypothetical protein
MARKPRGKAKAVKASAAAPARAVKPNGHANGRRERRLPGGGVNLRLKDKHDDLDGEFERY